MNRLNGDRFYGLLFVKVDFSISCLSTRKIHDETFPASLNINEEKRVYSVVLDLLQNVFGQL